MGAGTHGAGKTTDCLTYQRCPHPDREGNGKIFVRVRDITSMKFHDICVTKSEGISRSPVPNDMDGYENGSGKPVQALYNIEERPCSHVDQTWSCADADGRKCICRQAERAPEEASEIAGGSAPRNPEPFLLDETLMAGD